jgi:hypothetical protein
LARAKPINIDYTPGGSVSKSVRFDGVEKQVTNNEVYSLYGSVVLSDVGVVGCYGI